MHIIDILGESAQRGPTMTLFEGLYLSNGYTYKLLICAKSFFELLKFSWLILAKFQEQFWVCDTIR